jgi:hypothetical protein
MISIRTGNSKKQFFPTRLNSIPNHLALTSLRRYFKYLKERFVLDDKGRKRFFPTDSIDRNCDVLPIEYDMLIVMFVSINNIYVE